MEISLDFILDIFAYYTFIFLINAVADGEPKEDRIPKKIYTK